MRLKPIRKKEKERKKKELILSGKNPAYWKPGGGEKRSRKKTKPAIGRIEQTRLLGFVGTDKFDPGTEGCRTLSEPGAEKKRGIPDQCATRCWWGCPRPWEKKRKKERRGDGGGTIPNRKKG